MKLNFKQKLFVILTISIPTRIKNWVNYKQIQQFRVKQSLGSCGTNLTINGEFKGFGKHVHVGNHVNFNDNVFINGIGEVYIGSYFHTGVNLTINIYKP